MAFNEKYVSQAASGGGDGSIGNPWTFLESTISANSGDRINVLSDSTYSVGAITFPSSGTYQYPIIWRGYDSTIGDLDNNGRNSDGTLNTSGMPQISVTGVWIMAPYVTLQNLNISGSLPSNLIGDLSVDNWNIISCNIHNYANDAAASCIYFDDYNMVLNSDFICTGASHNRLIISDKDFRAIGCRFDVTSAANCIETQSTAIFSNCVFLKRGAVGGKGIIIDIAISATEMPVILDCTFYNLEYAVRSSLTHTGGKVVVVGCHATDCTEYISLNTNVAMYSANTRTRDIILPTGQTFIQIGEITTDTGDYTTDYTDATNRNLRLKTTAAGYGAKWNGGDIGSLQTSPPSGGSGTNYYFIARR